MLGRDPSNTANEGVDLGEESKSHLTQHHMYTYTYAYTYVCAYIRYM